MLFHGKNILSILRRPAPKPRELPRYGTGSLHDEQQHCFELGWREGIAAYRKMLRETIEIEDSRHD